MSVLLTRPLVDSQRIAATLAKDDVTSLIWPLTQIELFPQAIDIPAATDALVVSSGHAIRAFAEISDERALPIFCVGPRTAELARAKGFKNVYAAQGNFDALITLIRTVHPASVMYLRGEDVSGDMETALDRDGIGCVSRIVYAARPNGAPGTEIKGALKAGRIKAITIWSRRNSDLLCESIRSHGDWKLGDTTLIGISQNAVDALGKVGFRRIIVASRPNATQMIAEIRAAVR